jgi:hypothetical protein
MRRRDLFRGMVLVPMLPLARLAPARARGDDGPALAGAPAAETGVLLGRVRRVYAEARTYRDAGVVTTTFFKPDGAVMMVSRKPFTTAFVRPDRFRYEYTEERREGERPSRYLVARDAAREVRTWWDVTPGVRTGRDLSLALAGATGVSSGSANTVPSLLLTGAAERDVGDWTRRRPVERLADAETAGRTCLRFSATIGARPNAPASGSVFTYWVDAESLLLRRIESTSTFPDFFTEAITTYEPVLDADVPDAALAFDPPGPQPEPAGA